MGDDPFHRITDALGEFGNGTNFNSQQPGNVVPEHRELPTPLGPGQDPVCNGTGWLWEDAYGNQVKCWRCAGTGQIPNLIQPKQNQTISSAVEGDGNDTDAGVGFFPDVTQEGQIVSLNQMTGDK